jgi:hypothetical protein
MYRKSDVIPAWYSAFTGAAREAGALNKEEAGMCIVGNGADMGYRFEGVPAGVTLRSDRLEFMTVEQDGHHMTAVFRYKAPDVTRLDSAQELAALAGNLGLRPDWHEPGEQGVTAAVHGTPGDLDNAGFWGTRQDSGMLRELVTYGEGRQELWVELSQHGETVAEVNLATLFAWAVQGAKDSREVMLSALVRLEDQGMPATVHVVTAPGDSDCGRVEAAFAGPQAGELAHRYRSMGDMEVTQVTVSTDWKHVKVAAEPDHPRAPRRPSVPRGLAAPAPCPQALVFAHSHPLRDYGMTDSQGLLDHLAFFHDEELGGDDTLRELEALHRTRHEDPSA